MLKKLFVLGIMLYPFLSTQAQTIENALLTKDGNDFTITFDLLPKHTISERYDLEITIYKRSGETLTIQPIDGNLKDIEAGHLLSFTFAGKAYMDKFRGFVDVGINAKMVFSPLRFIYPNSNKGGKKGKTMNIVWQGGEDTSYDLELYRYNSKLMTLAQDNEAGTISWSIPKSTSPGGNYQLKLIPKTEPEKAIISSSFTVTRKIPIVVKVLPAVALGVIVGIIIKGNGSDDSLPQPPELPDIPN